MAHKSLPKLARNLLFQAVIEREIPIRENSFYFETGRDFIKEGRSPGSLWGCAGLYF